MALDPFLLEILVCPESKTPVTLISASAVAQLNSLIRDGKVKNRAGDIVKQPVDGGLLREDRKIIYPVRSDIPVLLSDEGLVVETLSLPV